LLSYPPIQKCLVLTAPDDVQWDALEIASHIAVERVIGGSERMHSVGRGLAALEGRASADDWVLVHDAARALLKIRELHRLFEAIAGHSTGGLLVAPVRDTLKVLGAKGEVEQTLDRSKIWSALTPQVFRYGVLKEAYEDAFRAGRLVTDEAQAVELKGGKPLAVTCESLNLKLTYPQDIAIFELFLKPIDL